MSADPLEGRERARPPKVIYLQWCGADKGDVSAEELATAPPHGEVTWCADKQFDTDEKYVLAGSLEQERWISVEERLPKLEHGGVGLCPCLFYAESTEKQFGGYYDPIYNDWLIATEDESRRLQVMDVSHWRPRPAPPVHKGDS